LTRALWNRREFLLAAAAAPVLARPSGPPPAIVLIQAGGVGAWMLGVYGNQEIRTPNIDLLARSGMRFLSHVAAAPEQAGGAALLTGRTPSKQSAQDATLSTLLAARGFECRQGGHNDALAFLDAQKANRPFFLAADYPAPAPPYDGLSAKEYDAYANVSFNTVGWEPMAPNAAANKELLRNAVASLRRAAAHITAIDAQVGALVQRIEQKGLRDATLILFTSPCGDLLGRHGLWGGPRASDPPNLYDEVVSTPMIWNWRGAIGVEGARPEIVSGYDLLPAVCELAGAAVPQGLSGRAYLRAVFNEPYPRKEPWRNLAFSSAPGIELARDARYKLVLRDQGKVPGDLFDLRTDPREKVNQYENPRFITVRERLTADLDSWRKRFA
jgi:arylsulfatase A-like enzyme